MHLTGFSKIIRILLALCCIAVAIGYLRLYLRPKAGVIWRTDLGSPISSTAVEGSDLIAGTQNGAVCVDTVSGNINWRSKSTRSAVRVSTSTDGNVYVVFDDSVMALDRKTGNRLWDIATGVWPCVCATGKSASVLVGDKQLCLIDARTGKKSWSINTGGTSVSGILVQDGRAYISTVGPDGKVFAIALSSHKVLWTVPFGVDNDEMCLFGGSGLAFHTISGYIYAVDRTSGHQLWSSASPVYYPCYPVDGPDGSVYFTDSLGNLTKLSAADGERIWTCSTGERISGPPAIIGNSLYLGAGIGHLFRVMQQSGHVESDFNISTLADRLSLTNRLVSTCANRPIMDGTNNLYMSTTYGWLFRLSPAR